MMHNTHKQIGLALSVIGFLAVAVLAGPAAASPESEAASTGDGDEFSLRHIPEALPLPSAMTAANAGWNDEPGARWQQQADLEPEKELSATKAVLYSLLLPGLGDWYVGEKNRAKSFFIVDATLWIAFIAFQVQGHDLENSYQELAQAAAGVSSTGHSEDFYSTVGQYNSSDDYEAYFKKESRLELWPDVGYDALESYYIQNRVTDFEEWAWESFDVRVDYRQQRSASKVAYRRSSYVLAAAALNRVVASMFAYQAVRSSRGNADGDGEAGSGSSGSYRLDISSPPIGARGDFSAAVSLIRSF